MSRPVKRKLSPKESLDYCRRVDGFKYEYDAARIAETKRLVSFDFVRGDLHTHSLYSDGWGSVADNWSVAEQRGLDFLFATDHKTVRQKVECRKFKSVWWGQEPGAEHQHIAILDNEKKFTPVMDLRRDVERLRELGCFFFFPHPVGWYPRTWYARERIDALAELEGDFAIEIMNGIFRTHPFHDEWQEACVAAWDEMLGRGQRVIGLAASDAHMPSSVGNVWTGVVERRPSKKEVLAGLRSGRVFASSGPAVNVAVGRTPMGGTARPRAGKVTLRFECADWYGLNWARVIRDGREVKRYEYRGAKGAQEKVTLRVPKSCKYVRVECAANDDRRAYSNPIYLGS